MKTKLPLLIFLLLLAVNVQAQTSNAPDPASWKRYTIKGEDFSIIFPTVPAMATRFEFSHRGDRDRRVREIGAYAEGVAYVVYSIENRAPKQSLESFIQERFGDVKTREVIVSGIAGREPVEPG